MQFPRHKFLSKRTLAVCQLDGDGRTSASASLTWMHQLTALTVSFPAWE